MSDTRWLTYDELAEVLGITPDSARRLVARKKWPRKQNNEGRALIAVPDEYLDRERAPVVIPDVSADDRQDEVPDSGGDVSPDITHGVRILSEHIERLEKELETVKSERDAERATSARLTMQVARIEVLEMLLDVERKRIEEEQQRTGDERQRAEELKAERDRWAAALEASQRQITHLTDKAASQEQRRGWWPFRKAG